jgi:hypothetical protein
MLIALRVFTASLMGLVTTAFIGESVSAPQPDTYLVSARLPARTGPETTEPPRPTIEFHHGDISWLPQLARQAGWPEDTWVTLAHIILRESGGCPNRRGGDRVDADCNITGIFSRKNRSDTGLLQINGLNYDVSRNKWALLCNEMGLCTQEQLLDPLTNLKAGYRLYQHSGWKPWDPCLWGKEYAKQCKSTAPLP